jgi:lysozyme
MLTEKGKAVIRAFEGRALKAYRDSVGVWTIGYGITNAAKWAVAYLGRPIGAGMTITEEQAEYLLEETYKRSYEPAVLRALPGAPANVTDAGGSFHWNTGAISRAGWAKAWSASKSATAAVRAGLMSWTKAGGKVLKGLERRREREWAMISKGDYGPEGVVRASAAGKKTADAPDHPLEGTPGMLRVGNSGPEVEALNDQLAALGFDVDKGDRFTPKTDAAVRAFQKAHPQLTKPDGVVGPATRSAIQREIDAKRKITNGTIATGGPGTTTIAVDQLSGAHLPLFVYFGIGAAIVGVIVFFLWHYRDELQGLAARARMKG